MNRQTNEQFILWLTLHRISDAISKHEENLFTKTRLTKTQHRILLTLAYLVEYNKPPIKITDLVPYQNSSLVSISLIIDRMEKKHLVKKVRDLSDRRVVSIVMTPHGKKLLKEASNPTTDLIKNIFSVFSDTELKQATSLMNKLLGMVESGSAIYNNPARRLTVSQRVNFLNKLSGFDPKRKTKRDMPE